MIGDIFQSETFGRSKLTDIRSHILKYIQDKPDFQYRLVIGTDSQPKNSHATDFVVAIVVHRVGAGGIYFWQRIVKDKQYVLRQRIYQEAIYSLTIAEKLLDILKKDGITKYDIEIHVDIGQAGATRDMIAEIVGMIRSSGYKVKTKPDSYGASKVADRHT
jgi:uncharacterized protein